MGRYVTPVLRHGTPRKLANILLAETELRRRKSVLRSRPYYYIVDICNVCNLRCPLCPTGTETLGRVQGMMRLAEYRQILDKIKDYALVICLYNHGEPFLNKDVFAIIDETARNNVASYLSSNFNWPIPIDPKDIVRSGLEYITCSLDGVSQQRYQEYRVGGDLDEAFDNMRRLLAARKALGRKTPFVEWQFIVFRHNYDEMEKARELAAKWGVDLLRFVAPGIQPESMHDDSLRERWLPDDPVFQQRYPDGAKERGYVYDRSCFYLYRSMSIYPGGGVTPCCFTHDRKDDFGDINSGSIMEIWNNRHFRSARMLFNDKPPAEERIQVVCDECPIYRQPGKAACTAHTSPLQVPSAVEPVARLEVHRRSGTEARRPSHSPHGRDEDTFTPAPPTTRC
jgi:MoaA/NifB/PqqE/SkfB family radical SAM enzyme